MRGRLPSDRVARSRRGTQALDGRSAVRPSFIGRRRGLLDSALRAATRFTQFGGDAAATRLGRFQVITTHLIGRMVTPMILRASKLVHVVSAVGAVAALAGASYVLDVPIDSVGSEQIIDSSVVSRDIKDGTLRQDDFAADQLPVGPAGPAGPAGPSDAYSASDAFTSIPWPQVGFQKTTVMTKMFPAGKYVITAQVVGQNAGSTPAPTSCSLSTTSGLSIAAGSVAVPSGDSTTAHGTSSVMMQGAIGFDASTDVNLQCHIATGSPVVGKWLGPKITAIKVGALHAL